MKLIIAIVNRDDAKAVTQSLSANGYSSTRLASAGGFLLANNATLLIGVEEEKVQGAIDIIRQFSHSRKELIPVSANSELGTAFVNAAPVEITVGGATVFVVDVERFEHL